MTRSVGPGDPGRVGPAIVTAVYAAIVLWCVAHHEPWRDEVVPLSIARAAGSLTELAAPLKFEGHPILWYLLLWVGWAVIGQTWVLKAASVGSAIAGVALFTRSPIRWWLRCLFIFSFFPLYQYSVICRGYGLEMLAAFAVCALHPYRRTHPVALALALATLANTEAFGAIMALAAGAMLVVEGLVDGAEWRTVIADRRLQWAALVYVCGLALSAMVAFPDPGHTLSTGFRQLDPGAIAAGIGRAIVQPAAHATQLAVLPMPSLWLWGYFVYLTRRPALLCFAATTFIGFEVFFNVVYGPGAPWHIGNVVLALVVTMWLDASESISAFTLRPPLEAARASLGRALAVLVAIVFAGHMLLGYRYLAADLRHDYSSNRRLADLLRSEPSLATAVVMGEPEPPLWSLPYYADHRIYLAREGAFRTWGVYGAGRVMNSDLDSLLQAARSVRAQCGCPVVITLGWDLDQLGTHTNFAGTRYEEHFTVTAEARARFAAATRPLVRLAGSLTDENYDVYLLP